MIRFRNSKRNFGKIDEYFINDTYLKKLYNLYIRQSIYEKILDYLVFFAIIFTLMSIILEYLMNINEYILHLIHLISIIIIFIFALELIVEYAKSKTIKHFFTKHWIDFILIVFLSFYFLFAPYFGLAKIEEISKLKNILYRLKHFKVSFGGIKSFFEKYF